MLWADGYYGAPDIAFEAHSHFVMSSPTDTPASATPSFRTTLMRVLGVQLGALLLLWLVQSRYTG